MHEDIVDLYRRYTKRTRMVRMVGKRDIVWPEDFDMGKCSACSGKVHHDDSWKDCAILFTCEDCGGLQGYIHEAYLGHFLIQEWDETAEGVSAGQYYDITVFQNIEDGGGAYCLHGWMNPETKRIIQLG